MRDESDMELLQEYAVQDSEPAFAELVERHIALVYSAALRHIGMPAQAEEITQAVFVILAQKASSLRVDTVLAAWLYETTRLTSLSFLRGERRRQLREQEAFMESTLSATHRDAAWEQLAPLLDEAMIRLRREDRQAVLLRFFQDKNLREVALALNINEAAAQKRVSRALMKLRQFFAKRGVESTTVAIAETIAAKSVCLPPAALAKSVTAVALAKGTVASTSTVTLVKGALKFMIWSKVKSVMMVGMVVLLAAGSATIVVEKIITAASLRHRLADGSVLELANVRLAKTSSGDELVAEFHLTEKKAQTKPSLDSQFFLDCRCRIYGEDGFKYTTGFFIDWDFRGPGFFTALTNGTETSLFPRNSKWLWFEVEKRPHKSPNLPWQGIATFKVQNPARSANYPWIAKQTPVTNVVGQMAIVLDEVMIRMKSGSPGEQLDRFVTVPARVFDHGVVLTNWGTPFAQAEDSSGNYETILQGYKSLDPNCVWKLDMDFETVSNFARESVATVDLPRHGEKITTELMNVPVTVSWDGTSLNASIPTNRPNLAIHFISAADAKGEPLKDGATSWTRFKFQKWEFTDPNQKGAEPAKVTLAIVPNVHATFYIRPRLVPFP